MLKIKYLLPLILILLIPVNTSAAVEFVEKTEVTRNSEPNITMAAPAGTAIGNLLIAYIAKDDNVAIYDEADYGNWNMLYNIIDDSQTCLYLAWRIATQTDGEWTWNADDEDWVGEILCYKGQKAGNPIDASGSDYLDSSDTPTAPSVAFSSLEAGSLVLQVFGCDFDDEPRTLPGQLESRFNVHQATDIGGAGGDKHIFSWTSPTGFNDPDNQCVDEIRAYDEDTDTFASYDNIPATSWSDYLELTIGAITCFKIRFNAKYYVEIINQISIDVYYSGGWHNIYEGAFLDNTWVEKEIDSTQTVTAMRVKLYNAYHTAAQGKLYEADFGELIGSSGNTGTAVFGIPASNEWTAATLVIEASSEEPPPSETNVLFMFTNF